MEIIYQIPYLYCQYACRRLHNASNFADEYLRLETEFYNHFQHPFIFSTNFGADKFAHISNHLLTGQPLKPENGGQLGEYDKEFNKWLGISRLIKVVPPSFPDGEKVEYFTNALHIEQYLITHNLFRFTGVFDKNGKQIFDGDTINGQFGPTKVNWNLLERRWSASIGNEDYFLKDLIKTVELI